MMSFTAGPRLSISSMRAEYFSTNERAVNLPDFMPSCNSAMVISSSSNGLTSGAGDFDGGAISRAAPRAGYKLAAAVVVTAFCRNWRRERGEMGMVVLESELSCGEY